MNEPPPVLHRGTMYSWPIGGSPSVWLADLPVGLTGAEVAVRLAVDDVDREHDRQELAAGQRRRSMAVASAEAVNWFMPITRAKVVSNSWIAGGWTPWVSAGHDAVTDARRRSGIRDDSAAVARAAGRRRFV